METGPKLFRQENTQSHHVSRDIVSNSVVMMMIISSKAEKEVDSIVRILGDEWQVSGCHIP